MTSLHYKEWRFDYRHSSLWRTWEKHLTSLGWRSIEIDLRSCSDYHIDTILKQFSMKNSKKDYLSIGHEIFLSKRDCPTTPQKREDMSIILYTSTVGSIIYAMICTRLDVASSLGIVSRYQSDLDENHWKVVKTILKYLKNTKD